MDTHDSTTIDPDKAAAAGATRPKKEYPEKHASLRPAMNDDAMSEEAYTDHALALKNRDRSQISAWRAFMAKFGLDGEPIDPNKRITEAHFFDVFGKGDPKMGLSDKLGLSYEYGQEKTRQFLNWFMKTSDDKLSRGNSIGSFDWNLPEEGASGTQKMGPGPDWRQMPKHLLLESNANLLDHKDPLAQIGETKLIGQTKQIGETKLIGETKQIGVTKMIGETKRLTGPDQAQGGSSAGPVIDATVDANGVIDVTSAPTAAARKKRGNDQR